MTVDNDMDFFRGLLGARMGTKDHWVFVFAGRDKTWVTIPLVITREIPPTDGMLIVGPVELIAKDVKLNPHAFVSFITLPKARVSRRAMEEALHIFGFPRSRALSAEKDLFLLFEPHSPKWVEGLTKSLLTFVHTGTGVENA